MNDILFTSPEFIRSVTIVSDNLQDKYILSSIREAQDIDFQQVVGSRLYKKLKALVEDESITLEGMAYYRELLDKAQYFIAYQTLANLTVNSTFKINNVGVNTISDENVQSASLSDTFKLSKYYVDKADHYKMMLQKWLLKYKNKFPELQKQDVSELSAEVHSAASCNLFLGGARGKQSNKPCDANTSEGSGQGYDLKPLSVTENGSYKPKDYDCDAFSSVEVNVQIPTISVSNLSMRITSESANLTMFETSAVTDMNHLFRESPNLVTLNVSGWDVSNVENMEGIFERCLTLENLNIREWNPSSLKKGGFWFANCGSLKSLDLSNMDLSSLVEFHSAFEYCRNMEELNLSGIKTSSNLERTSGMFHDCEKLKTIDLSSFDLSGLIYADGMFTGCRALETIKLGNNKPLNIEHISSLFYECNNIKELDLSGWGVSKANSMSQFVRNCSNLVTLNLSGWDMSNITDMFCMFEGANKLENFILDGAILPKRNTDWYINAPLTVDSIVSVLNALPQLSDGETYNCQIGGHNIDKLSDTQKSIATNKGWTLS